ncbi:MAG: multicopper oxidase domain-containing protein, partial [bacterium]
MDLISVNGRRKSNLLFRNLTAEVCKLEDRTVLSAYADPLQINSVNGLLDIEMLAHRTSQVIEIAQPGNPSAPGIPTLVDGFMTYAWKINNGAASDGSNAGDSLLEPTLHVKPGDILRIRLKNGLGDQPTNFHTHGLVISPAGDSDNVIISIPPGMSNTYEYQIPADAEAGVAWYHPHRHEYVLDQVYRGLAGFLVVGSASNDIDQVQNLPSRMMMIRSESFATDPATGRTSLIPLQDVKSGNFQMTVNNLYMPDLQMQNPYELWVGLQVDVRDLIRTFQPASNNPADWYFDHPFTQEPYASAPANTNLATYYVAQDGSAFPMTVEKSRIALASGKRVSEVITSPAQGQSAFVVATAVQPVIDPTTGTFPSFTQTIIRITGSGTGGTPGTWANKPLTSPTMQYEDLSKEKVDVYRTVVFETRIVDGKKLFLINGQIYPNGPVFQSRAGEVEQWEIINKDPVPHPIHIHMQHFQSQTGYDWAPPPHTYDQDVWYADPNATSVLRIRFKPTLGESVFHCHILLHEDNGMMSSINVIPAQPLLVSADADFGGTARFYPLGSADSVSLRNDPVAVVQPFGPNYKAGMVAAMGDVNFDGVPDGIFAANRGGRVVVLDGASNFKKVIYDFKPFGNRFARRMSISSGDVNGDNRSDILVAGGPGGNSVVRVFSGATLKLLSEFTPYEHQFRGGLNLAAGDVDGSGRISIITAPASAHSPEVK